MAKKLHANMITAGDIKKRHPRYLNCETDKQYAELAKEIYDVIYDELDFMDDWQIKNASISYILEHTSLRLSPNYIRRCLVDTCPSIRRRAQIRHRLSSTP